ncbi:hypothetical protein PQG02_28280 [Nostoc sp. UHCC 0926]|uniref:hypothetical protein n=1 Tax=unclassified Nostoc TaxID=2593658 RepID=UPI002360FC5C|nr:hypothetical protein [Nostoc sp. UHCC 0926]WDD32505.1 hypothetical protein PQG02_28280 [Nostoc sp. UHCC 0926]
MEFAQRLGINQYQFVSPGVVTIPGQTLGFKNGFLVKVQTVTRCGLWRSNC